ncbi:permease-like cell division protein FtsX [Vibrio sp. RC27]
MATNKPNTMNSSKNKSVKRKRDKSSRTSKVNYFARHYNQAKQSLIDLWNRPIGNLLTLAVISMSLAMPACLYLLSKNVAFVATHVATPSQISVFIEPETPEARIMVLKDSLESLEAVKTIRYISSQQGLEDLSKDAGFDEALTLLDQLSLPGVLVIKPGVEGEQEIKVLVDLIRKENDVTDVRLDEDWLSRLKALKDLVELVVISLSTLMLSAVFLIIGNSLRFSVLEHKEEIQTMKLIGATDAYILRPYLYSGMWLGLIGSVVAWFLTALLTLLLNEAVTDLAKLYDSRFRLLGLNWDETLLLLMLGTIIGCVAARLSAQRHLKEIEPV